MTKTTGKILKSDQVELEGQFNLGTAQAQMNRSTQKNSASATPQVRILENNPEYAVIGVVCSCGMQISIRCDYADAQAEENSKT